MGRYLPDVHLICLILIAITVNTYSAYVAYGAGIQRQWEPITHYKLLLLSCVFVALQQLMQQQHKVSLEGVFPFALRNARWVDCPGITVLQFGCAADEAARTVSVHSMRGFSQCAEPPKHYNRYTPTTTQRNRIKRSACRV